MTTANVQEFKDDEELKKAIDKLANEGKNKDKLCVMSHDDDRTDRVADSVKAGKLGEGFSTEKGNVYTKKGDELRAQFKELGFSQDDANELEEKLDHGTILLVDANE